MLLVDDNWEGTAAKKHKDIVPFQKTALGKVKSGFTDGIGLALSQLRSAIKTFKAAARCAATAFQSQSVPTTNRYAPDPPAWH